MFFDDKKSEEVEVVVFGVDLNGIKGISMQYGIESEIKIKNIKTHDEENKSFNILMDRLLKFLII